MSIDCISKFVTLWFWVKNQNATIIDTAARQVMSNIVSFAKNLVLSADEKLLRKMGLHNDCGEATQEAYDLIKEKLVKDNEPYLLEIAKAKQEEDKANKN